MEKQTNEKIKECVGQVVPLSEKELSGLTPEESLIARGLHSISAVQLIVLLEEVFQFEMDDVDLLIENVSTLQKIETLLKKYDRA